MTNPKKSGNNQLNGRLNQIDDLASRVKSLKIEKASLYEHCTYRLENQLKEPRESLFRTSNAVENAVKNGRDATALKRQQEEAQSSVDRIVSEQKKGRLRIEEIDVEVRDLRQQISQLSIGASVDDLAAHNDNLSNALKGIATIEKAIQDCQSEIEREDWHGDQELEDLQRQREDLLASIVLGESKGQDGVAKIDKQIESILADKEGTQAAQLLRVRNAEQTMIGLQKRLVVAKESLAQVQAMTYKVMRQYFIGRAAQEATEYMRFASATAEAFSRLKAIKALLERSSHGYDYIPSVFTPNQDQMILPGIMMIFSGDNQSAPDMAPMFKSKDSTAGDFSIQEPIEMELETLRKVGVGNLLNSIS